MAEAAAPASGARPAFSIGAIADCQYVDAPDVPPRLFRTAPSKLAAAIADFNRQPLAFVVHLGDFIDRDWRSFDTVMPIADGLRHPWIHVLGNHDFAVEDELKARVPVRFGMPARYYSFVRQGWLFLVTDGNGLSSYAWPQGSRELAHSLAVQARLYPDAPRWNGGIDEAQMLWLDRELDTADRRGLKAMVFSHFPVWPENLHNLWNAADVLTMIERHPSVKVWLDGHNHDGNYGIRAGIHYLNLKAMLDTPETAYARLDFFPDRIEVRGVGRQEDFTLAISSEDAVAAGGD